ncbi:hypothetical protein PF010_g16365 [Phytophthora fragariae]|uniref:Uncharacterized protein n=1 Tax=Phytophthora fragariae TaxID=53985 RepID=A0A6G0KS59_9STRA|nr:hypothetical protein PF010_g16365 [Phytophthora fragariae]
MAVTRSESGAEVNTKKEKKSPEAVDSAVVRAVMDDMECEVNAVKDEESVKNEEQDEDNLRGDEATADMVEPDGRGPNRGGGTGIIILEEDRHKKEAWVDMEVVNRQTTIQKKRSRTSGRCQLQ